MEYRVISLSLGGRGNKVFKSGDIVFASQLVEENIPSLIEGGYIEPLVDKVEPKVEPDDTVEPEVEKSEKLDYKDITAKELKVLLGLEDSTMTKKELYAEYLKLD